VAAAAIEKAKRQKVGAAAALKGAGSGSDLLRRAAVAGARARGGRAGPSQPMDMGGGDSGGGGGGEFARAVAEATLMEMGFEAGAAGRALAGGIVNMHLTDVESTKRVRFIENRHTRRICSA
jgi:hypothetical protein